MFKPIDELLKRIEAWEAFWEMEGKGEAYLAKALAVIGGLAGFAFGFATTGLGAGILAAAVGAGVFALLTGLIAPLIKNAPGFILSVGAIAVVVLIISGLWSVK